MDFYQILTRGVFLPMLKDPVVSFSKIPFFDPILTEKLGPMGPNAKILIFGPIFTKFAPEVYFCPS